MISLTIGLTKKVKTINFEINSLSLRKVQREREIPEIGMHRIGAYIGERNPNRLCFQNRRESMRSKA